MQRATRSFGLAVTLGVSVACHPRVEPAPEPPPTTPESTHATPAAPPHALLPSLVPVDPGTTVIAIEDIGAAIEACEAAGWPEMLPPAIAARLPETAIGSHATIVHPAGTTEVTVDAIGCQAPGDIEGPIAFLELEKPAPEGPPDPRVPESLRGRIPGRPHLAAVGSQAHRDARLIDPTPLPADDAHAAAWRAALAQLARDAAQSRRERCVAEGQTEALPPAANADDIAAATSGAPLFTLRDGSQRLVFAVLNDAAVTFDCYGTAENWGVLLDEAGELRFETSTNNGVDLQWIVDLDGDGTDEAVLDRTWMEDGMHDVGLVLRTGDAWEHLSLWSADTP